MILLSLFYVDRFHSNNVEFSPNFLILSGDAIWNQLSQKVYENNQEMFADAELKEKIHHGWNEIGLAKIRKAIS